MVNSLIVEFSEIPSTCILTVLFTCMVYGLTLGNVMIQGLRLLNSISSNALFLKSKLLFSKRVKMNIGKVSIKRKVSNILFCFLYY